MIREAVARRYARALFEAAEARDLLDTVAEDLRGIGVLLRDHPEFHRLLTIPKIDELAKRKLISELFGGRVHALVVELLFLVLEKKRFPVLAQIIEGYRDLLEEHRGIVRAEITTAVRLPEPLEQILIQKLERRTSKTVLLVKRVDASILGGMMVRIGDRIMDRSIRRTLEEIKEALMTVPVYD
ncbi:MAG: F0F1 ATP synthase subunit delta [Candidatus Eisenbacteria sp.]|nr:F0F1 ATP synthase subunit delta [Candidatus Eisenbacteria bacterium]